MKVLQWKKFTCAHDVTCKSFYENCQADYIQQSLSPHSNIRKFDNNYKCIINHLTEIAVFDYYTLPDRNHTTVTEIIVINEKQYNEHWILFETNFIYRLTTHNFRKLILCN